MDVDGAAGLHPSFLLSNGSNGPGPQLLASDSSSSLEDRLIRGQDDVLVLSNEEKAKALEILGRTELGRKRAEEYFGEDVWNASREDAFAGGVGIDQSHQPHGRQMYVARLMKRLGSDPKCAFHFLSVSLISSW